MLTLAQFQGALMELAGRMGASLNSGRMSYADVEEVFREILHASPLTASMDALERGELADTLAVEASRVDASDALSAIHDIRDAVQPLMGQRKTRATLMLAAYRVTNGRLSSRDVEDCVNAEINAFMRRVADATARKTSA